MKRVMGVLALATVLALTGCGGHVPARSGLAPVGQSTSTPASNTTGTATTSPQSTSSDASQLASIDRDLDSLRSTLSGIDSNITQADKAADNDN